MDIGCAFDYIAALGFWSDFSAISNEVRRSYHAIRKTTTA